MKGLVSLLEAVDAESFNAQYFRITLKADKCLNPSKMLIIPTFREQRWVLIDGLNEWLIWLLFLLYCQSHIRKLQSCKFHLF